MAARKDKVFHGLLSERGVRVFRGTEALLRRLRDGGVPTGLVTASRNAGALLAAAGIGGWFDVVVDGTTAQQLHLTGKPDPMMFDYYLARTAHGSTLSRVVHASVLAQIDPERAWTLFREALVADLDDTPGGTTREGVHLGAMAGTVDMVRKAFAGLRIDEREMTFDPRLPAGVKGVRFRVHHQGHHVAVNVEPDGIRLHGHDCETPGPLLVKVGGASAVLDPGVTRTFASLGGNEHMRRSRLLRATSNLDPDRHHVSTPTVQSRAEGTIGRGAPHTLIAKKAPDVGVVGSN